MPRGLLLSPWWQSGRAIRQTRQTEGACSPLQCVFCLCYKSDIMCRTAPNVAALANSIVSIKGASEVCIQAGKREKTFNRVSKGELKFRWQEDISKSQSELSLRAGPAVAAGTGPRTHHLRGQRRNESSQKSQQLVTNKSSLQLSQCFTTQQTEQSAPDQRCNWRVTAAERDGNQQTEGGLSPSTISLYTQLWIYI